MKRLVLAAAYLILGIACIVLPFCLKGCTDTPTPLPQNMAEVGRTRYGVVFRIEDAEKGNLIYLVEQTGGGFGGITVVPVAKK